MNIDVKQTFEFVWHDLQIRATYEPKWMVDGWSHLEVRSFERMPISQTHYRSYFAPCGEIEAFGGVEAFVTAWLDEKAKSPEWQTYEASRQQLGLFD